MNKILSKFNINSKEDLMKLIKQFFKFGIVGGVNTVLSYIITNVSFYALHLHEQISNFIAFFITVFISFMLNRKFVFKSENEEKQNPFKQLLKVYASYSITGLFLTAILLFVEETYFGIPHYIATLLNLIVTIPLNFLLNKLWAFK